MRFKVNSIRNNSKQKKSKNNIFTTETLGVVLILFSALCLVCLITYDKVFSRPGELVANLLAGAFGYFAVAVCIFAFIEGFLLLLGKKFNITKKKKFLFSLVMISIVLLLQVISMRDYSYLPYGEYLSKAYEIGGNGIKGASAGGIVLGLISYFFSFVLTNVGAYVIISLFIAFALVMFFREFRNGNKEASSSKFKTSFVKQEDDVIDLNNLEEREYPVDNVDFDNHAVDNNGQRLFVNNPEDFAFKSKRDFKKSSDDAIKFEYGVGGLGVANSTYQKSYSREMEQKINYIKTPATINIDEKLKNSFNQESDVTISKPITESFSNYKNNDEHLVSDIENEETVEEIPYVVHDESNLNNTASDHARDFSNKYIDIPEDDVIPKTSEDHILYSVNEQIEEPTIDETEPENVSFDTFEEQPTSFNEEPKEVENFDNTEEDNLDNFKEDTFNPFSADKEEFNDDFEQPPVSKVRETRDILFSNQDKEEKKEGTFDFGPSVRPTRNMGFDLGSSRRETPIQPTPKVEPVKEEKPKKDPPPINRIYHKPPIDLLKSYIMQVDEKSEDHEEKMAIIKRTLEEFHINADVVGYVQGPTITRYEIKMLPGVSVKKVISIDDDLQMRLATKCGIRIEAPIPGKDLVGIEVANNVKVTVGLRELLEQSSKKPFKPGSLMFALGKNLVGEAITDNLAKGPHYLVAGATGSGKSVALNVMIVSMLMRYSPEELRLILVDPKSVEFGIYEHLPHLMIDEIITEPQKAIHMLQWAYVEMQRRFEVFRECGERIVDLESYNERIASATVAKIPRIVIVIDELADLMESCKKDMESKIRALAQKSRAVGIHLVLATQRPSVDIVTGTIKANLPSRVALKVMNSADSMTILGNGGAEKLLGNGDMLYQNSSMGEPERYQGAWVSDEEITNVVEYIKEKNKAYFDDDLSEYLENALHPKQEEVPEDDEEGGSSDKDDENRELFIKSLSLAISVGTISISLIQRRFRIGYAKAGWLVDQMEMKGYISGNEGSKARKVLISREEFEAKYGNPPED